MVLRLRHKERKDEVYGWNPNMAKMAELEEFDDDDPNAEVPQTEKTPDVRGRPPQTVVGDDPQAVMDEALARAAAQGEAEVTTEVTEEEVEEEYFLADDSGEPILDTDGNTIATDADGNQLDPSQVPATAVEPEFEPEPEQPKKKSKK